MMKSIDVRQEMMKKVLWLTPMRIRQVAEQHCVGSLLTESHHLSAMGALKFVIWIGGQESVKMKPMEEFTMNGGQMKFADQEIQRIPREMQIVKEESANVMTIIMLPNVKVSEVVDNTVLKILINTFGTYLCT